MSPQARRTISFRVRCHQAWKSISVNRVTALYTAAVVTLIFILALLELVESGR